MKKESIKPRVIIIICFVLIPALFWLARYEITEMYSFNGIVEKVSYGRQHQPTVTINGIEYYLNGPGWGFASDTIKKGDKMIKRKGDRNLLLIKPKSKDTINFNTF
jgi:hypothetical protein